MYKSCLWLQLSPSLQATFKTLTLTTLVVNVCSNLRFPRNISQPHISPDYFQYQRLDILVRQPLYASISNLKHRKLKSYLSSVQVH